MFSRGVADAASVRADASCVGHGFGVGKPRDAPPCPPC